MLGSRLACFIRAYVVVSAGVKRLSPDSRVVRWVSVAKGGVTGVVSEQSMGR